MPTTLTISIDRTALALAPLLMDGSENGSTALGIVNYTEPAIQARVTYAPTSPYVHGDVALGWSWQQSVLGWEVAPFDQATEQDARDLISELTAALTQSIEFEVTVTVNGASPEVWLCNPGSVVPLGGRTTSDIEQHNPTWSVTIPCYPVRS